MCKINIKKQKGFTLLEIMIIVLIMGIVVSVSFLNYSKGGAEKSLVDAQKFIKLIEEGKKRSMIFNQITGISYTEEEGLFLVRFTGAGFGTKSMIADPSMWASSRGLGKEIKLEKNPNKSMFSIYWNKMDQFVGTDEKEGILPFLVIFNDGTVLPDGELTFLSEDEESYTKISWKTDGKFEIK